jgi:hypothetical protein
MVVRPAADPAGWVAADLGPLFDELAAKCGRGRWRIGQGILARRALS